VAALSEAIREHTPERRALVTALDNEITRSQASLSAIGCDPRTADVLRGRIAFAQDLMRALQPPAQPTSFGSTDPYRIGG
jgi:hypothetical protein